MTQRLLYILLVFGVAGCTFHVLPRPGAELSSAVTHRESSVGVILDPVRLYPPSPVVNYSSDGTDVSEAAKSCSQGSDPEKELLQEGKLTQLAMSEFSKSFPHMRVADGRGGRSQSGGSGNPTYRIIPAVLEFNCGIESARGSIFAPLLVYGYSKTSAPVSVKVQGIVIDDASGRVLFAVEHLGEYEESASTQFGILLLYTTLRATEGRQVEEAFRSAFAGLASQIQARLDQEAK